MNFSKAYNRIEFVKFLRTTFLPEDFVQEETPVDFLALPTHSTSAVKLGTCRSLDLVVYEIRHKSKNDARVGLSKEVFRLLADELEDRALVAFVPEDSNANYRFSFIEITLDQSRDSSRLIKTYSNPRRYSYYLGEGIATYTPNLYLNGKGRVIDKDDLRERFSVEVLTKAFYQELSDWYAWAVKIIRFPNNINDPSDDALYTHEGTIRLITRLIFVWFLKQKKLVPDEFFDEQYIAENLIENFNPHAVYNLFGKSEESKYYKAILQNLFFAMLNSPITDENDKTKIERRFRKGRGDYDNNKLMRYKDYFSNPDLFVELANSTVPFLNGGLFDCLDDKDQGLYYDGFSDREVVNKYLIVPDYLFFGEEVGKNIDLSEWYGDSRKKKVSARGIIDILKRYNFTVEENTPFDKEVSLDPELLGKVFENLLAAYNPETKTTARKQTGSFYTPREIVQYMVDESLVQYLKQTVGENLEPQYRQLMQYSDEYIDLSDADKHKIIHALYECKVLDPACGSGAFPVGVLQQMVHLLQQLDPDNVVWRKMMEENAIRETSEVYSKTAETERQEVLIEIERNFSEKTNRPDYARKLYLIENCIFGVDIQPIAIQISKLRFFISLVVDQKTNNDPKDNFGIRPLPNLEAKFVAANSLMGLDKKVTPLFDSPEIKGMEEEMKIAKHKIFSAKTVRTKRKYRQRVDELKVKIAGLIEENDAIGNEEAKQLASWDMFDQNASAPFFDAVWMFGIKDGFDIVIGNPPYVQLQNNKGALAEMYKDRKFETFARTGDIYCLFYERGYQLLKNQGHLCYITSNKWMRAGYGEKTRGFIASKTNPKLLIDFAGVKVFEGVTVDTNILLFEKGINKENTICAVTTKEDKDSLIDLSLFVQQGKVTCTFNSSDSWVILSPIEQSIKQKIEAVGTPLKEWNVNIYRGVLTGCNEAFFISTDKRNEILSNCKDEEERKRTEDIIRPILRGRDIKQYSYEWADLWLINTHNGMKGKIPPVDINEYPAIKLHLDQFWNIIEKRADQGNTPYNLRNCAYMEEFFKPKICWKAVGRKLGFAIVEPGIFLTAPASFIAAGTYNKTILSYLCSSYGKYFIYKYSDTTGAGDIMLNIQSLIEIPIPKQRNMELEEAFEKKDLDLVDSLIYKSFGLSNDEIEFIKKNT